MTSFKIGFKFVTDNLSDMILDSEFEVLSILGQGGFGKVYQVKHVQTDKM